MPNQPRIHTEVPGPASRRLRERESKHIAPGFQAIAAYAGIAVERGQGCDVIDVDGNRFLDLAASICVAALGYGHPAYLAALHEQLDLIHAGSFTTEARVKALERVLELAPEGLDRLQLYSGGTEAVESAMRLARAFTGKFETLSFWGGFHGKTAGALAQMGSDFKHGLGPLAPGAYITPYADCAHCPFGTTHPECGLLCVEFARKKLRRETTGSLAAILVEPMQGTAGNVVPPPDFLPALAELAREQDALLIADEMITGFGRTGRMFGVEHTGTRPDIMTIGKSLGGGFPVSGVLAREEVAHAEPWSRPSFSSSSYGGHPLAGRQRRWSGGGLAMDHGSHTFYLAFDWLNAWPTAVTAKMVNREPDRWDTEDDFSAALTFPGERMAHVYLTWTAGARAVVYTIHGDRGAIIARDDDIEVVTHGATDGTGGSAWNVERQITASDWMDASHAGWFNAMFDGFVTSIENHDFLPGDSLDACCCIAVINSAYASAAHACVERQVGAPAGFGNRDNRPERRTERRIEPRIRDHAARAIP